MSWVFWKFTEFGVCSVTSRCPPDYSVTDKMAPHKFLFWPRVQVNHAPGQGATGPVTCPGPGHLVFSSNILVMALFRVQGWHRLDGCPELHLMVSLEFPYFLEVLGNISKLCWLHLICDGSLGSLTIDQPSELFTQATIFHDVVFLPIHSSLLNISKIYSNILWLVEYSTIAWLPSARFWTLG